METFTTIPEFPRYSVSNLGRIINDRTGREMAQSPNQFGDLSVGLTDGHGQYRRSVKLLVARAFVSGEDPKFNTPMVLDGDKHNLRADNIVWRPRWLAWEYNRQFNTQYDWYLKGPIRDVFSGERYNTIFEAAIATGQLCKDIYGSLSSERRVFPTGAKYAYAKEDIMS